MHPLSLPTHLHCGAGSGPEHRQYQVQVRGLRAELKTYIRSIRLTTRWEQPLSILSFGGRFHYSAFLYDAWLLLFWQDNLTHGVHVYMYIYRIPSRQIITMVDLPFSCWGTITVLVLVFHRVSVSRSQDIPFFGPPIPEDAAFDKNEIFREFMLTKCMLILLAFCVRTCT